MRPVLLFDGDCGFCTACARRLPRLSTVQAAVEPWQFADLVGLGVSAEQTRRSVVWVGPDGVTSSGAQAFAHYLQVAGGPWTVLGAVLRIPPFRWLAAGAYRLIASQRHRLPGDTPACESRSGSLGCAHW